MYKHTTAPFDLVIKELHVKKLNGTSCGVVVQCIDFSPITQEPGVQFHAGGKSSVTIGWTKGNRGLTNAGQLWCYQWTFHEPQKANT